MTSERPTVADDDHRVIKFRPRTLADAPMRDAQGRLVEHTQQQPEGLARYERSREPDDYRHRMIMNAAAAIATLVLTGFGVWLAMSISDLRKTQDCILIGRRDCAPMPTPHS